MTTDTVPAADTGLPSISRRAALAGLAASAVALGGPAAALPAEHNPDADIFAAYDRLTVARRLDLEADRACDGPRLRYRDICPPIPEAMRLRSAWDQYMIPADIGILRFRDNWMGKPEAPFFSPEHWRWLSANPPLTIAGKPADWDLEWIKQGLAAAEEWEAAEQAADELSGYTASCRASDTANTALLEAEREVVFTPARTVAGLALQAAVLLDSFDCDAEPWVAHFLKQIVQLGEERQ